MTSSLDPEQRSRLLGAKLTALVAARDEAAGAPSTDGAPATEVLPFAAGTAVRRGDALWVLLEDPGRGLGSVLAWAQKQDVHALHVVVDGEAAPAAGRIARQATLFERPPTVWSVEGRSLVAVLPEPVPTPAPAPPDALALAPVLATAGLDVVVEHGAVTGEVLGLEVARVVLAEEAAAMPVHPELPLRPAVPTSGARIEVGVGRNDRELFGMLHGDLPADEALARVARAVRRHRAAGLPAHPLNRLAGERWLRTHLLTDPTRLAGWTLAPIDGVAVRAGVMDVRPAFAAGTDASGTAVVLACSVGIDLELVPEAADTRARHDPHARLVIAVPARDAHASTRRLAEALRDPAEILPIEGEWRV